MALFKLCEGDFNLCNESCHRNSGYAKNIRVFKDCVDLVSTKKLRINDPQLFAIYIILSRWPHNIFHVRDVRLAIWPKASFVPQMEYLVHREDVHRSIHPKREPAAA